MGEKRSSGWSEWNLGIAVSSPQKSFGVRRPHVKSSIAVLNGLLPLSQFWSASSTVAEQNCIVRIMVKAFSICDTCFSKLGGLKQIIAFGSSICHSKSLLGCCICILAARVKTRRLLSQFKCILKPTKTQNDQRGNGTVQCIWLYQALFSNLTLAFYEMISACKFYTNLPAAILTCACTASTYAFVQGPKKLVDASMSYLGASINVESASSCLWVIRSASAW